MSTLLDFQRLVALCQRTDKEIRTRVARAVDAHLVVRNFLFGLYIVQFEQEGIDRASYGKGTLKALSQSLKVAIGRGFSVDNLELMRRFFCCFRDKVNIVGKSETLSRILTEQINKDTSMVIQPTLSVDFIQALSGCFTLGWSHYVELLSIDSPEERCFYEIEAVANQWSVRELNRQIDSLLYQRLALSRDKDEVHRLATEGQVVEKATDLIKNPLVLEFLDLEDRPHYTEDDLESAIIDQLETFLLELGKGFLFEARQKRFTFDNDHFFVDLVFYNRLLRCYVLIDLKRTKLTHQDLGQMQMYVKYFDRFVKLTDELPTIGIVLCPRKNDAIVELTLPQDANIFASKYLLYLPSKEELKVQLETIANNLEYNTHNTATEMVS